MRTKIDKERERTLLEVLLRHLEIGPNVTCRESPDFLLDFDSGPVGVEVTELFQHPAGANTPQAAESRARGVVAAARATFEREFGDAPSLRVSVVFSAAVDLRSKGRMELARAIAGLVGELVRQDRQHVVWRAEWGRRRSEGAAHRVGGPRVAAAGRDCLALACANGGRGGAYAA